MSFNLFFKFTDEEVKLLIQALDDQIKYSTPAEAVPFKNIRAELQDTLFKHDKPKED